MNKIGIFGGTFDPVHNGHLITAEHLLKIRALDKIIFIPCNISPHKLNSKSVSALHRLNMVKLALKEIPSFEFSSYELDKGDVSFTLDTLRYFSTLHSNIELIIGYDNIINFDNWREPDEILKLANLVVMKREIDNPPKIKNQYFDKAIFVETPIVNISSTEIRNRLEKQESIKDLVPEKVEEYIIQNNLYLK